MPFDSRGANAILLTWVVSMGPLPTYANTPPADAQRGQQTFNTWCAACHGEGPGHPGTAALAAKYHGTPPALLERRSDLTGALIRLYVRNGLSIMPIFRKTEVSDSDLDDLVAYLTESKPGAKR